MGGVLACVLGFSLWSPPQFVDLQIVSVLWSAFLGIFVMGLVLPLIAIRRVKVEARAPRDATVGDTVLIDVTLSGRSSGCEVRALDPTGEWRSATSPVQGQVPHLADRRGLFQAIRIEVRITAPLGLLAAHRVHEILLPFAVEVAPRPLAVTWAPSPAPVEGGHQPVSLSAHSGDLVRSVRPYVSGDPSHLVHWPSSARIGSLVVRELEPPRPSGQAIVVDLSDLGAETERAASYALGACRAVLGTGGELVLATREAGGPVVGPVRSVIDAGRRLARAVPGPPAAAPPGWPVVEIGR